MIKLAVFDIPDSLAAVADELLLQLKAQLEAEASTGASSEPTAELTSNKQRVQVLMDRCKRAGREIRKADVIAVCDVDESQFYKWQRGGHVADSVRRRIEKTLAMPAADFLERLDHARPTFALRI
jgi:hypothetical protein